MRRGFSALYVHVPFCAAKCDYCAFYSIPDASAELRGAYLKRLGDELAEANDECGVMSNGCTGGTAKTGEADGRGRERGRGRGRVEEGGLLLESVYVGGGTPSCLTCDELDALLTTVRGRVRLTDAAEFTVECNPDSLTPDKAAILARRGANRVSLGVQSFEPRLRDIIGRRTSLDGLSQALDALRANGIANIGMDLIYAIPGQTLGDWCADVRRACEAGIRHLSTYELTVEEGSGLGRGKLGPASEELAVAMWEAAEEVAGEFGLRRYEVSNLAQPGYECRHNDHVWHGGTYLGVGPAASSFDGELRWTNPADLAAWLEGTEPEEDRLPPEARAAEVLAFGLRTVRGWRREEFRERTGFDWMQLRGEALRELAEEGLLTLDEGSVRPTQKGLLFADHIARALL